MPKNLELFLTFARISASCFGGGYAMLPFFQRELVLKKKWLTDEQLLDLTAVAQCTPGVIAVNTATFCGYRVYGFRGAVFATLGVLFRLLLVLCGKPLGPVCPDRRAGLRVRPHHQQRHQAG